MIASSSLQQDSNGAKDHLGRRLNHAVRGVMSQPNRGTSGMFDYKCILGLSILYASAYFLPATTPLGAYFLQTHRIIWLVVVPSLIAIVACASVIFLISALIRYIVADRIKSYLAAAALAFMVLIALKGFAEILDYDWVSKLGTFGSVLLLGAVVKLAVFLVLLVFVVLGLVRIRTLALALSSIGFAFGMLGLIRLMVIGSGLPTTPTSLHSEHAGPAAVATRRVVWVIFDESDFLRIYGSESLVSARLTNFNRLARRAVFATNANSPASATLYSIPSLLTGVNIGKDGVQIDSRGFLFVEKPSGDQIPFGFDTSIFGKLAATNRESSVLGFYHPYCKIFLLDACTSLPWPSIGGLSDALWSNVPSHIASALGHRDQWESITRTSVALLPDYLARTSDSLTFIHLNIPHLPADYANSLLGGTGSADPLMQYSRNVLIADDILGTIVAELQKSAVTQDTMLIVSSDHWLRNRWYRASQRESSRPIPFLVWKVGDTQGIVLSHPFSTVHTSDMIMAYLNGSIGSQSEIAKWLESQTVYSSFIVP